MSGFGFRIDSPNMNIETAPAAFRPRWQGIFHAEIWERRKSGTPRLLRHWKDNPDLIFPNGVTNVGIEDNESTYFRSGTQITSWYMGLINNSGFSALAATDTMSSHAGWTELGTSASDKYDETTRPQWSPAAPSSRTITNTSSIAFTINTTVSVKGAFIVSNNTKGGTSGILWASGAFSSVQSLVAAQILRLTYTLTGASS
jgi:hypothetical protein